MGTVSYRNVEVTLDDEYLHLLDEYSWQVHKSGYLYVNLYMGGGRLNSKRKKLWMHRLITNCPSNKIVDHINGNKLDNRKENLRVCSQSQNQMNSGLRKTNTSGSRGVSFLKGYWVARIGVNGKRLYLGSFRDKAMATLAYNKAALKHYGDYARTTKQGEI